MRTRLWMIGGLLLLAALPAAAQETRGNIAGTVSDRSGVIPGAAITVTNVDTGVIGGAGSTEYTIDGATNYGQNRQMATSPNADMVQEMRIETANFDAAVGHGSGLGISMMTRAGTNQKRGTVTHQYWSNRLNGADFFKRQVFET
jgi:hypothetical protein